ncbi:hypothetical protein P692DRAFT_20871628 [Suillus brevipes Sb2]|nr:hypothetical protein P692DRAFT_20871628 [Suillus brevipes Sb2]
MRFTFAITVVAAAFISSAAAGIVAVLDERIVPSSPNASHGPERLIVGFKRGTGWGDLGIPRWGKYTCKKLPGSLIVFSLALM